MRPRGDRGVALVITLILLAVITTLAIAFLALTSRETGAVDAMGRTTDSELAAESALERAKAQIVAPFPFFNQGNDFGSQIMGPDLTVSVAWDTSRVDFAATPFNELTNLLRDPSPPVFVDTNRGGSTGPGEDRFHLDLNRNSIFEQSGHVPVTLNSPANNGWGFDFERQGGQIVTNWLVGDPQWIGILQDPSRPHGPDNRFIARYAFLIQPIGRSLDVNWMHNQALDRPPLDLTMQPGGYNGFYRNQGVGTWELNMAGLLTDLNANYWNDPATGVYGFDPLNIGPQGAALATSAAFIDAREFLRYRYSPRNWNLLAPVGSANRFNDTLESLLPGSSLVFGNDFIDSYTDGPFSFRPEAEAVGNPPPSDDAWRPWPGADSRRHFSSIHDFFDRNKLTDPLGFVRKLELASGRGNSYDRYTYYRMLAQLGTDSEIEHADEGKINLNYVNVGGISATQLIPWSTTNVLSPAGRSGPELFLVSVVTNLLVREPGLEFMVNPRRYPGTGINVPSDLGTPFAIPVFTNNSTVTTNGPYPGPLYCGRIHQILQQAANIHDATTGPKANEGYPYFPSVFRPQFAHVGGNVYITNYVMVTEPASTIMTNRTWHDLEALGEVVPGPVPSNGRVGRDDGVYGIPLIIGARKGYPNFNEFAFVTTVEMTRRLEVVRSSAGRRPDATNQTLTIAVYNQVAVEARNSYTLPSPAYPRNLDLFFGIRAMSMLTNRVAGVVNLPLANWITGYSTSMVANTWRGGASTGTDEKFAFRFSPALSQTVYAATNITAPDSGLINDVNHWAMGVTNRMLFFLVDKDSGRIVDAVTLSGPRTVFDISKELDTDLPNKGARTIAKLWRNGYNTTHKVSEGVASQLDICMSTNSPNDTTDDEWKDYSNTAQTKTDAVKAFSTFLSDDTKVDSHQAPYAARVRLVQTNYYRVNDPLVHYTLEDFENSSGVTILEPSEYTNSPVTMGTRNLNSIPWNNGGGPDNADAEGTASLDPTVMDPGMTRPDRWDFPTNTFANIGWLGRVHRGTPWQSIYLKSKKPGLGNWRKLAGPSRGDASNDSMVPTRDWELADLFTTALHPNASRGRLSVNQTNLAAWSAVLSGVVVGRATNDGVYIVENHVIAPAAVDGAIATIVDGINRTRTNTVVGKQSGQFSRLGHLLATPELTFQSPFLNTEFNPETPAGAHDDIRDADYERIPQQILSLLKVGEPRFVVYAWGQSLKPARYGVELDGQNRPQLQGPSIVTAGDDKGLCINYQITGETATKSVIRVDFDPLGNGRPDYRRPHAVVESFNVVPTD